jgi:ABC-2 type transport system permease protein
MSASLILEGIFGISFKGYVLMVIAGGSLQVIAYLALGAFLQLLVRDLPTGLRAMGAPRRASVCV